MDIASDIVPYFDDFNIRKNFLKILFKSASAIQVRELNQLQTILENQLDVFGDHIFKNNTVVKDIDINYFDCKYVLIAEEINNIDAENIIGNTININDKTASIIHIESNDQNDPTVIYYNSDYEIETGQATIKDSDNNLIKNINITEAPENLAKIVSITNGIVYHESRFVYIKEQTHVIGKFTTSVNCDVGLELETIIVDGSDPKLLDNSFATNNIYAHGADRLLINAFLTKRPLNVDMDDNFILLLKFIDGDVQEVARYTEYGKLGDWIARRTNDESGSYTTKTPYINFKDIDDKEFLINITGSKSYVKGYEVDFSDGIKLVNSYKNSSTISTNQIKIDNGNYLFGVFEEGSELLSSQGTEFNLYSSSDTLIGSLKYEFINHNHISPDSPLNNVNITVIDTVGSLTRHNINNAGLNYVVGESVIFESGVEILIETVDVNGEILTYSITSTDNKSDVDILGDAQASTSDIGENATIDLYYQNIDTITINNAGTQYEVGDTLNFGLIELTVDSVDSNNNNSILSVIISNLSLITEDYIDQATTTDNIGVDATIDIIALKKVIQISEKPFRIYYSDLNIIGTNSITNLSYISDGTNRINIKKDSDVYLNGVDRVKINGTFGNSDLIDISNNLDVKSIINVTASIYIILDSVASNNEVSFTFTNPIIDNQYNFVLLRDNTPIQLPPYAIAGNTITFLGIDVVDGNYRLQLPTLVELTPVTKTIVTKTVYATITDGIITIVDDDILNYNISYELSNFNEYFDVINSTETDNTEVVLKCLDELYEGSTVEITYDSCISSTGHYSCIESYRDIINDETNDYDLQFFYDHIGIDLLNTLDFRASSVILAQGELLLVESEVYAPVVDTITVDTHGKFDIVSGTPDLISPLPPPISDDKLPLFDIIYKPLTKSVSDITYNYYDNRRFTMRDIGKLKKRVDSLEYYVSFNQLEKSTAEMTITDENGLNRFKNGFLTDRFDDFNASNINTEYKSSIDIDRFELRPELNLNYIDCSILLQKCKNISYINGKIVSEYSSIPYISQNVASGHESITPFLVFLITGDMTLTPNSSFKKDVNTKPDLIVDLSSGLKGTNINAYRTIANSSKYVDLGKRVTDVNLSHYIPSTTINVKVTGMHPNTTLIPFFDDVDVSLYCRLSTSGVNGSEIKTDNIGSCDIIFDLPNNKLIKFNTGDRIFKVVGNNCNSEQTFYSGGFNYDISRTLIKNKLTIPPPPPIPTPPPYRSSEKLVSYLSLYTRYKCFAGPEKFTGDIGTVLLHIAGILLAQKSMSKLVDFKPTDVTYDFSQYTESGLSKFAVGGAVSLGDDKTRFSSILISSYLRGIVTQKAYWKDSGIEVQPHEIVSTNTIARAVWGDLIGHKMCMYLYRHEPLAQDFMVYEKNGVYLTACTVYFSTVDTDSIAWLEIHEMVNGYPSSTVVGERAVIQGNDITVSSDGSIGTKFVFNYPIYIKGDGSNYCFVIGSPRKGFEIFTSEIGKVDLMTGNLISKQPSLNTMFKSQNTRTWNAEQTKDIKFELERAKFNRDDMKIVVENKNNGMIMLDDNPFETEEGSNLVRVHAKDHGFIINDLVDIQMNVNTPYTLMVYSGEVTIGSVLASQNDEKRRAHISNARLIEEKDVYGTKVKFYEIEFDKTYDVFDKNEKLIAENVNADVISAEFIDTLPNEVNGISVSNLTKDPVNVIHVDSIDSFIIQITGENSIANRSGRVGDDNISIEKSITYDEFTFNITSALMDATQVWTLEGINSSGIGSIFTASDYLSYDKIHFDSNETTILDRPLKIATSLNETGRIVDSRRKSVIIEGVFESIEKDDFVTPVIDGESMSLNLVTNRVDYNTCENFSVAPNATTDGNINIVCDNLASTKNARWIDERDNLRGSSIAKYVTKTVTLSNPANELRVIIDIFKDAQSDVEIYYKILPIESTKKIENEEWVYFKSVNEFASSNTQEWHEIEYRIGDTSDGISEELPDFKQFVVKIVMKSRNSSKPPKCKNFRAIAIT